MRFFSILSTIVLFLTGLTLSPVAWSLSNAYLVKDINPQWGSDPWALIDVGGVLFFNADNGTGEELWKSDGTPEGTVMVKDISPDPDSFCWELAEVDGIVFFGADDGIHGWELWKTDGTPKGTLMVKDIKPGEVSAMPQSLAKVNGMLFFSANGEGSGQELWKSDGTAAGTVMVKDINPRGDSGPYQLTEVNGLAFFVADDGTHGSELWKTDGTAAGTVLVKDIHPTHDSRPSGLTHFNGTLFFVADDSVHGRELWKSDGTEAGTVMVKDLHPTGSSKPWYLVTVNRVLFFIANDGVNGIELWKSDGTSQGTVLVKDIYLGGSSEPRYLTGLNGTLFVSANDGIHGRELWKSDGTAEGTMLVTDINVSPYWEGHAYPAYLTPVGNQLFFRAQDGIHGAELWQTDGTGQGTMLVKDINTGTKAMGSSYAEHFAAVNGSLFVSAIDDAHSRELWGVKPPLDFRLTNTSLNENQVVGTLIAQLTPTRLDHTYALVAGEGDTDNEAFQIVGNTVKNNIRFDYDTQHLYRIRVQTANATTGESFEKRFVLTVADPTPPPPPTIPSATLTVALAGKGIGKVNSTPAGISCSGQCTQSYPYNTAVTLVATPATGSLFTSWSGQCQGTSPTTQVTITMATSCIANFDLLPPPMTLTVTRAGTGQGTVLSQPNGIECGDHCRHDFDSNTTVTLTAIPATGSTFTNWNGAGDCKGTQPSIKIFMNASWDCVANFNLLPPPPSSLSRLKVVRAGAGEGSIVSTPSGIECGNQCIYDFPNGATITLTATPTRGSTFTKWSGQCQGTSSTVQVVANQAKTCVAQFDRWSVPTTPVQ